MISVDATRSGRQWWALGILGLLVCMAPTGWTHPRCPPACLCVLTMQGVEVSCNGATLEEIFINLPHRVVKLGVHKTTMSALDNATFSGYPGSYGRYLRSLDLSDCAIPGIASGVFRPFPNLENLNLSTNQIDTIADDSLVGLDMLTTLGISHNNISQKRLQFLHGLTSLMHLDLSMNNISDMTCSSLKNFSLNSLQSLQVVGNSMSDIDSCLLLGSEKMLHLNISSNNLKTISEDAFSRAAGLQTLSLRNNALGVISINPIGNLANLSVLSITGNNLLNVPTCLTNMSSLRSLHLSDNPIRTLRSGDLTGMSSLTEFHFRRLPDLNTIEPGAFDSLASLRELAIEENPLLRSIPLESIPTQQLPVTQLLLRNNGITRFEESAFVSAPLLERAEIGGNPLRCDCGARWIRRVIREAGIHPWARGWDRPGGPTCETPKPMNKLLVAELAEEDLTCDAPQVVAVSAIDTVVNTGQNVTLQAMMWIGIPTGTWFNPAGLPLRPADPIRHKVSVDVREERLPNSSVVTTATMLGVSPEVSGQYTLVVENANKGTDITFYVHVLTPSSTDTAGVKSELFQRNLTLRYPAANEEENAGAGGPMMTLILGGVAGGVAIVVALMVAVIVKKMKQRAQEAEYKRLINQDIDRRDYYTI